MTCTTADERNDPSLECTPQLQRTRVADAQLGKCVNRDCPTCLFKVCHLCFVESETTSGMHSTRARRVESRVDFSIIVVALVK